MSSSMNLEAIKAEMETALQQGDESALACLFKFGKNPSLARLALEKLGAPFHSYRTTDDNLNYNFHLCLSEPSKVMIERVIESVNILTGKEKSITNLGKVRHSTIYGGGFKKSSINGGEVSRLVAQINSEFEQPLSAQITEVKVTPFYAMLALKLDPKIMDIYWKTVDALREHTHPNNRMYIPPWFKTLEESILSKKLANIEAFGTHSVPADRSEPEFHITVYYGAITNQREFNYILQPLIGKTISFDRVDFKPQNPNGSIDVTTEGGAAL